MDSAAGKIVPVPAVVYSAAPVAPHVLRSDYATENAMPRLGTEMMSQIQKYVDDRTFTVCTPRAVMYEPLIVTVSSVYRQRLEVHEDIRRQKSEVSATEGTLARRAFLLQPVRA